MLNNNSTNISFVNNFKVSEALTNKESNDLLQKKDLNANEIESLLKARDLGVIDFLLVDTREKMEWLNRRIKGTNFLIPTTNFYQALEQIEDKKETAIILYCLSGSRSAYCQGIMQNMGYKSVSNFDRGIMTYNGDLESGE